MSQHPAEQQRAHWESVYQQNPRMYGLEPSEAGIAAAARFQEAGVQKLLELGAGHGRDSLWFARQGLDVLATDFSAEGLEQLTATAATFKLKNQLTTQLQDVRDPLPHEDAAFDAVYAHLLLTMALSTEDIHRAVAEIRRVLKPGGVLIYTVRHTGDAHYGQGIGLGDDMWVNDGFAVHFFSRELVESLAQGWDLEDVAEMEEGELPRRIWKVTQTKRA